MSVPDPNDIRQGKFHYGTPDPSDVVTFLKLRGYHITFGYGWRDKNIPETPEETKALNYLFSEWDYCFGHEPDPNL